MDRHGQNTPNRPWARDPAVVEQSWSSTTAPTGRLMLDRFLAQPIREGPYNFIDAFVPFSIPNQDRRQGIENEGTIMSAGATYADSTLSMGDADACPGSPEQPELDGHPNNPQEVQGEGDSDFVVRHSAVGDAAELRDARMNVIGFMSDLNDILRSPQ